MRKRLDDLFSLLMLLAAVAVVVAGWWVMMRSIARAGEALPTPVGQAPAQPLERANMEALEQSPAPERPPLYIYHPDIPLSAELQTVFHSACAEAEVPEALVLGVMEVESRFQTDAVSAEGCYGLMQLNPAYFPACEDPADNIRAGVWHLRSMLERYRDTAAALTVYNAGSDTGSRDYADAVMEAAERWAGLT